MPAGVTDATVCYSGQSLFDGLDQSFGYLTVEPGWCNGGTCRVRTPLCISPSCGPAFRAPLLSSLKCKMHTFWLMRERPIQARIQTAADVAFERVPQV